MSGKKKKWREREAKRRTGEHTLMAEMRPGAHKQNTEMHKNKKKLIERILLFFEVRSEKKNIWVA